MYVICTHTLTWKNYIICAGIEPVTRSSEAKPVFPEGLSRIVLFHTKFRYLYLVPWKRGRDYCHLPDTFQNFLTEFLINPKKGFILRPGKVPENTFLFWVNDEPDDF